MQRIKKSKYSLGNQVGLIPTGGQAMIIKAIRAFEGSPHDRKTIPPFFRTTSIHRGPSSQRMGVRSRGTWKTSDGQDEDIDFRQTTEKRYPVSKAKEAKKVPMPSGHGTTHRPPQNRTSHARKRFDGRQSPTINASMVATGWH